MTFHLYWLDKNWQERGCANHFNLLVHNDTKTYETYINPFYDYRSDMSVEVVRRSDITDFIRHLESEGYTNPAASKEEKEGYDDIERE